MRLKVEAGGRLMIGGFIAVGGSAKRVIVRALGPSLTQAGISNALADPVLELRDASGASVLRNFDWRETQQAELLGTGLAPTNDSEAAADTDAEFGRLHRQHDLAGWWPGCGFARNLRRGSNFRFPSREYQRAGNVGRGNEVMIGGFIVRGPGTARLIVRAIGPSLAGSGISEPLTDPILEIRDSNGALLAANNDWRETQEAEINGTSLAPLDNREAVMVIAAGSGAYTAIVQGNDGMTVR